MTFDVKLRELIGKIEHSHLSQSEKNDVYASIRAGLHAAVWPMLILHMPEAELNQLASNAQSVTPEAYFSLIRSALEDQKILVDLESLMQTSLDGVEKVLKEKFIIQS